MKSAMFERDLLYPTNSQFEPGSVHVIVYQPEPSGGIPVVIEAKTAHNPLDYVPDIIGILQADVFDRIRIKISDSVILYIKPKDGQYYKLSNLEQGNYRAEPVSLDSF